MQFRTPVRPAAVLAGLAVSAASLVLMAPTASAAPVFTDAQTQLDPFVGAGSYSQTGVNTCANTPSADTTASVPVVENGPAASVSTSGTATFTNSGVPGDTATGSASASGTGKVTSVGGSLSTMDLSVTSSAQVTNALGTSAECVRYTYAGVDLEFEFTVTQPGFLELSTSNTGGVYGEAYVYRYVASSPDEPYVDHYGNGLKFNSNTRAYLPAGTYRGYFEGEAFKRSLSSSSISGTTTLHGEFHVAGSQTEAVKGKGKKYVTFPAARSCATDQLLPTITDKKKRVAKIKKVVFFVNDTKVKTVKTPDKGDTVKLAIADDVVADVRAEVTLFPARKGRASKVLEATVSYEACS